MSLPLRGSMWSLGGLSLLEMSQRVWRAFQENQLSARSAQFAYFSMLATVPLLIVTLAAITWLPLEGVTETLLRLLERTLPPDAFEVLASQVDEIQQTSTKSLVLASLVVFFYSGARLFLTIGEGLNAAFGVPPRHRRARAHGLSLLMTLGIVLLLLVSLALLVIGPMIMQWMMQFTERPALEEFLYHFVRWVIVTFVLLTLTATLFSVVPAAHVPFRWLTPGNVFTVAGWMLVSQGFRFYVENFGRYNETYGALGGVIVLLLWLYFAGGILFAGGQINGVIVQANKLESTL